tara:strand:- start:20 stop:280 length:261 start_codon:yes stop_codon:yes gene_type:complete
MTVKAKKALVEETLNTRNFTILIEEFVARTGSDYLDAMVHFAEKNNVEIDTVAGLVRNSHVLKAKLAAESEKTQLIKRTTGATLPI